MLFSKKQNTNDQWDKNTFTPASKIKVKSTVVPSTYFKSFNEWALYISQANLRNKFSRL